MSSKKTEKTTKESGVRNLQEDELLFRSFVQQNIDGIILINPKGIVTE